MKKKFSVDLTTQNKLIITALLISTALIVAISFWAVNRIKVELDESYRSFGQLLTKTLAVQNYEITQTNASLNYIKAHVNSILSSTDDISYITFKNKSNNIIYTTIENYSKRAQKADTNISSPILDKNGNGDFTTFKERVLLTDDFKTFIDSCKTEDVENAIKFIIKNGCALLKKYKVELNNHISTDNKRQPLVMLKNPIITKIFLQSSAAARCKKDWPKLKFTTLDKKSFDTIGIWEI